MMARAKTVIAFSAYATVYGKQKHMVDKETLGDIRYSFDHDKHMLYAERHDSLTKQKVYAEWQAIQQLDGFDPAYDTLVDYSDVSTINLDYDDVKQLGRDMSSLDPRTGNVAIVTGHRQGGYLMARFYCLITNLLANRKHQVFQSRAEAEAWLSSLRKNQ